jgi:signal transduction histidine kinase
MQDLLSDHPDLLELARQAALHEYGLPSGRSHTGNPPPHLPRAGSAAPGALRADATPPELVNLVRLAARLTGTAFGAINIVTEDQQHTIAAFGVDPGVCSRDDSMCSKVFQSGEVTVVPDATLDERFSNNPYVNGVRSSIRSYASVPLISPGGFSLGSLCVFSYEVLEFDAERREGLGILATQIVEVLELQLKSRQLADALAAVRRSNEDLAGFAARVSHDLKNPLTAILGYAELTEEDDDVSAAAARYFRIIKGSAGRMLATVEEVLEFSRVGSTLTRRRVSLAGTVDAVLQDLRPLVAQYGAGITVLDAEFKADRTQVRALLQNLIANAISYSLPGTAPRIEVAGSVGARQVLTVTDHGKGIAAADRARVLEPLVRLHREGDPAGTGIGLATCARIAWAHGGTIEITGTPGGGTTVTVDLGPAG